MSKPRQQFLLVQKLITSYFSMRGMPPGLLSLTFELDSLYYTQDSKTSDFCYVSETLVSKRGNLEYYLSKCNTVSEKSPRHAIFETSISFDYLPSLSDVNFSTSSPTGSYESVACRRH